ncbi:unnamed protein product [Laminaria digitata]
MRRLLLLVWPLSASGLLNPWTAGSSFSNRIQQHRRPSSSSSSSSSGGHGSGPGAAVSEAPDAVIRDLLECFQGEFDNYDQVVEDRKAGMPPGPGGGHEHIHCSLKVLDADQVPPQVANGGGIGGQGRGGDRPLVVVAAKYYFNGDASVVFRYRLYSFHAIPGARGGATMKLWRLFPAIEGRLRAQGYDLASFDWGGIDATLPPPQQQQQLGQEKEGVQPTDGAARTECDEHEGGVVERIVGCEVYWSRGDSGTSTGGDSESDGGVVGELDGGSAAAAASGATTGMGVGTGVPFLGLMGEDDSGTWIKSQNVDGLEILVKDDLKVWPNHLWVNDRGFDREGNFVYGNQRGVPYKMRRVVAGGPLEWTLGAECRTKELYAQKMSAIGVTPGQRFGPPVPRPSASIAGVGGGVGDGKGDS